MSLNVGNVFNALRGYFISLDLRILAFKKNGQWINIVGSLFFSEKPVEQIKKIQDSITFPELKNFKLFTLASKSSEFGVFSRQVNKNGLIRLPNSSFGEDAIFIGKFNPRHIAVNDRPIFLQQITDWKLLGGRATEQHPNRINCWEILEGNEGLFISLGFESVYDWINNALRISKYRNRDENTFIIGLPIKAKIDDLKIKGNVVSFSVEAHKNIRNLQLNLVQWEPHVAEWRTIDRKIKGMTRFDQQFNDYVVYSDEIKFSRIHLKHFIRAHLISTNIPLVEIDQKRCDPPLENSLEPLVNALEKFYHLEEFKNQLLYPEKLKKKRETHGPSWYFEEAVSWLLSLGGLSVIRLGEKENIHLESGYTISADILAYKENDFIFVIDCDTQHADPEKANHLLQIVDHFEQLQNEIGKPEIIPVIFTPKEPVIGETQTKVHVINGPKIERLLEKAIKGDTEGFCNILIY